MRPRDPRLRPYPGEYWDKRAARVLLYKYAVLAPIRGHAIALAGTEPEAEVELMRNYLQWPAKQVWFVDRDRSNPEIRLALRNIKQGWHDVNVQMIDLKVLAPKLGAIGFANLDFMGQPLTKDNIESIYEVVTRMLPGAIMGLTWLRCRESVAVHHGAQLLYEFGKGKGDERRWSGMLRGIDKISRSTLEYLDRYEYRRGSSAMAVAIFRSTGGC